MVRDVFMVKWVPFVLLLLLRGNRHQYLYRRSVRLYALANGFRRGAVAYQLI